MRDDVQIGDFADDVEGLEKALGDVSGVATAFSGQLTSMRTSLAETTRDLGKLESGFSSGLKRAFDGLVLDGASLSDTLMGLGNAFSRTAYNAAVKPVTDQLGGLLAGGVNSLVEGLLPFADGAPFSQGRVMPFAKGGVVSGATAFGMAGGMGVMGEAGPEAIMPLTRGADGSLGVKAQSGGAVTVNMNITTPDVQGFQRSQGQVAAEMARALGRGQRNN